MTAPFTVTRAPASSDALDALDAQLDAAANLPGVPRDPLGILADPLVAAHVEAATASGVEAARLALAPLRLEAVPAVEAAAAPYVRLRAELDRAFKAGELHTKFGNDGALAQRAYEVEKAGLDRDLATAVRDAVAALRARLEAVAATIATEAARAEEPVALTPGQSRAMTDVLTLLPHLTPAEQVRQLDAVVATATRAPTDERRGGLRHVLPLLRSLATRPAFARTTDDGQHLYVLTRRTEALLRDRRHHAAAAVTRYAGVLAVELARVETGVLERGTWNGSAPSRYAPLRVAIAAPATEEPSRWQRRPT